MRHLRTLTRRARPSHPEDEVAPDPQDAVHAVRLTTIHEAVYADLVRFVRRRLQTDEAEDVVAAVFAPAWIRLAAMSVEPA